MLHVLPSLLRLDKLALSYCLGLCKSFWGILVIPLWLSSGHVWLQFSKSVSRNTFSKKKKTYYFHLRTYQSQKEISRAVILFPSPDSSKLCKLFSQFSKGNILGCFSWTPIRALHFLFTLCTWSLPFSLVLLFKGKWEGQSCLSKKILPPSHNICPIRKTMTSK